MIDWTQMQTLEAKAAAATEAAWTALRAERDQRIEEVRWRLERSAHEIELGLTPSEDRLALLAYVQALRDVPGETVDPAEPSWPILAV